MTCNLRHPVGFCYSVLPLYIWQMKDEWIPRNREWLCLYTYTTNGSWWVIYNIFHWQYMLFGNESFNLFFFLKKSHLTMSHSLYMASDSSTHTHNTHTTHTYNTPLSMASDSSTHTHGTHTTHTQHTYNTQLSMVNDSSTHTYNTHTHNIYIQYTTLYCK